MKRFLKILFLSILLTGCSSQGEQNTEEPINTDEEEQTETSRAKVVVLAGQSNMEGNTWIKYLNLHYSNDEINKFIDGYPKSQIIWDNNWSKYANPSPFLDVRLGQGVDQEHFGPEIGIADTLDKAGKKETIYFIKYGRGGTTLYSQWRSPSSGQTGQIWPDFVEFVKNGLKKLKSKGLDPELCALCWLQGGSDSYSSQPAEEYYSRESCFVNDFREEFEEYAAGPGIGLVDSYILDSTAHPYHQLVNGAKQRIADESILNVIINPIEMNLPYLNEPTGNVDIYHYDSDGMIKLGEAIGNVLLEYFI